MLKTLKTVSRMGPWQIIGLANKVILVAMFVISVAEMWIKLRSKMKGDA